MAMCVVFHLDNTDEPKGILDTKTRHAQTNVMACSDTNDTKIQLNTHTMQRSFISLNQKCNSILLKHERYTHT